MNGIFERRADKRRKSRSGNRCFDPVSLNQRQQEILNLASMGVKGTEIAKMLGVTTVTVGNAINSTLGKEKMALMRGARDVESLDVAKRIQEIIPKAIAVYEKILTEELSDHGIAHAGASIALQKATADTIMKDFSGMVVPKKVLIGHAKVTPELIEELKKQGKEAAKECGLIETFAEVVER